MSEAIYLYVFSLSVVYLKIWRCVHHSLYRISYFLLSSFWSKCHSDLSWSGYLVFRCKVFLCLPFLFLISGAFLWTWWNPFQGISLLVFSASLCSGPFFVSYYCHSLSRFLVFSFPQHSIPCMFGFITFPVWKTCCFL